MNLEDIQKRFEEAIEKRHWERLKTFLFSEDKEILSRDNLSLQKFLQNNLNY